MKKTAGEALVDVIVVSLTDEDLESPDPWYGAALVPLDGLRRAIALATPLQRPPEGDFTPRLDVSDLGGFEVSAFSGAADEPNDTGNALGTLALYPSYPDGHEVVLEIAIDGVGEFSDRDFQCGYSVSATRILACADELIAERDSRASNQPSFRPHHEWGSGYPLGLVMGLLRFSQRNLNASPSYELCAAATARLLRRSVKDPDPLAAIRARNGNLATRIDKGEQMLKEMTISQLDHLKQLPAQVDAPGLGL